MTADYDYPNDVRFSDGILCVTSHPLRHDIVEVKLSTKLSRADAKLLAAALTAYVEDPEVKAVLAYCRANHSMGCTFCEEP